MNYVGVDLHKYTISVCVVTVVASEIRVVGRRSFVCQDVELMKAFFGGLGRFRIVVEATAAYEWFVQLVEPLAERVVLAHPKKLRIIAESTRKSDRLDAQVLAEELARGTIPEAWRPTPRVRQHRALVRYRCYVQRRITSVKSKVRNVLANYNADRRGLFTAAGREYVRQVSISPADRILLEMLLSELDEHARRLPIIQRRLREFAAAAPVAEREARELLATMPGMGPVTIDVVLSELGDWRRFGAVNDVVAYAGLAPGFRASAGKSKQLGITKEGSRWLRWALIQLAWRLVGKTRRWGMQYEKLKHRRGAKKAIVAIARRLLCTLAAMLRDGRRYRFAAA